MAEKTKPIETPIETPKVTMEPDDSPGETIIVTKRSMATAPTQPVDNGNVAESEAIQPMRPAKVKLEPLSTNTTSSTAAVEPKKAAPEIEAPSAPDDRVDSVDLLSSSIPDAADGTNTIAGEAEAADVQRQEVVAALIESREYFLPIDAGGKRANRIVAVCGAVLIIALGLLLVDLMLDAGFISIPGVKPLTHLFSV